MKKAPRYMLTVEIASQSNIPSEQLLKRALKCLGRSFDIRCVALTPVEQVETPKQMRTAKPRSRKPAPVYPPETIDAFCMPKE